MRGDWRGQRVALRGLQQQLAGAFQVARIDGRRNLRLRQLGIDLRQLGIARTNEPELGERAGDVVELSLPQLRLQSLVEQNAYTLQTFPGFFVGGLLREYRAEIDERIVAFGISVLTRVHCSMGLLQKLIAGTRLDRDRVDRRRRAGGLDNTICRGRGRLSAIVGISCAQCQPPHGDRDDRNAHQTERPGSPVAAAFRAGGDARR